MGVQVGKIRGMVLNSLVGVIHFEESKMNKYRTCIEACQQCIRDCQNCLGQMLTKSSKNDCPKCCLECAEIMNFVFD